MGKQIRYPEGITDIALTTRHVLDVGRLYQHQLEMTFEHMPHLSETSCAEGRFLDLSQLVCAHFVDGHGFLEAF